MNTNDVVISSNDDGRGKNDASRDKDRKKARMEKRAEMRKRASGYVLHGFPHWRAF